VSQHAAGPLGAARVAGRRPSTDAGYIRESLAQVAELAALLITDDSIRAEPVPDISQTLELLNVPGSALDALALAEMTVALAAMRVVASDLKRLDTSHAARRTASLRVDPPARELESTLAKSISPDGQVLGGQNGFGEFALTAREPPIDYMAHVTINLTGAPAGAYVLGLTVHDTNSGKAASADLPALFGRG